MKLRYIHTRHHRVKVNSKNTGSLINTKINQYTTQARKIKTHGSCITAVGSRTLQNYKLVTMCTCLM